MTCHEIPLGDHTSGIENTDDDWNAWDRGYAQGYADSRQGQKINSTIYDMDREFRSGYLDGYAEYTDAAMKHHREDEGMES